MALYCCNNLTKLVIIAIFMKSVFFMNCTHDKPKSIEIVGLEANNAREFSLQVVPLKGNVNITTLNSDTLKFISNARLMQNLIPEFAKTTSSFPELAQKLQSSMQGEDLALNLSSENGVYRGKSFESVLTLSAYYHLDRIYDFLKSHLVLTSDALTSKLNVAVYGQILASDQNPIPITISDNALFVGSADAIFLLPIGSEEGLPLSMHEGVLAHEVHHRVFFKEVWTNPQLKNLWPLFVSRYDPKQKRFNDRSRVLLNALDEALADVFAVAYTGLPDYLSISLTEDKSASVKAQRDLNGRFAKVATYDALALSELEDDLLKMCGEKSQNFNNLKFNNYCLGTVIAKAIYEAADGNIKRLRSIVLPLMATSLGSVAKRLNRGEDFDLDVFWDAMIENSLSPDFTTALCSQIKLRFSSLANKNRIPSCKNHW